MTSSRAARAVAALAAFVTSIALVMGPARATASRRSYYAEKVIGYSVDHRPIVAYHLGTPGAKRAVLLGQMHGNEPIGVRIAHELLAGRPIEDVDLWVIPTMNPDGSAAGTRQNAHSVDLNRNFPFHWRSLHDPYWSGPRALSEPESRAIYRFLRWFKPALMVSIHQPLDGVDSTAGGAKNAAFRDRLARGLGLPVRPFTCPDSGGCYGSMTSWYSATHQGAAVTVEFPAHPSTAMVRRAPRAIVVAFGGKPVRAEPYSPPA